MHPLEKSILAFCQRHGLFAPGDRLVVGVSGGPDSMALLHLLSRFLPDLGISMIVAHADHGLRPEAAEAEATMVRAAATALGLAFHVCHLDVAAHAKNDGLSIEEAARDLRYAFFAKLAADTGANKIAVAHTADDQAEAVLLRLIRGTGRKGLSGMNLLRDGTVARPLLATEKSQIVAYLQDRGIPFAIDSSNTDRRYLRNKIRLDLLPYLARFNPGIAQTLRQTAAILQDEDALLDTMAQDHYRLIVCEDDPKKLLGSTAQRAALTGLPPALSRRIIEKMLIHAGAKVQYRHIESLMHLAAKGAGQAHLEKGLRAVATASELRLHYPWGKKSCRTPVPEGESFLLTIKGPGRYYIPETGTEIVVELYAGSPGSAPLRNLHADFFDAATIHFPITIRNRRPGDRLCHMATNCPKAIKVSEILRTKKIPPPQRHAIPIAVCGNQIIAILGVCIDARVKASATTTTTLIVTTRRE